MMLSSDGLYVIGVVDDTRFDVYFLKGSAVVKNIWKF
jgi:hypothetical protein